MSQWEKPMEGVEQSPATSVVTSTPLPIRRRPSVFQHARSLPHSTNITNTTQTIPRNDTDINSNETVNSAYHSNATAHSKSDDISPDLKSSYSEYLSHTSDASPMIASTLSTDNTNDNIKHLHQADNITNSLSQTSPNKQQYTRDLPSTTTTISASPPRSTPLQEQKLKDIEKRYFKLYHKYKIISSNLMKCENNRQVLLKKVQELTSTTSSTAHNYEYSDDTDSIVYTTASVERGIVEETSSLPTLPNSSTTGSPGKDNTTAYTTTTTTTSTDYNTNANADGDDDNHDLTDNDNDDDEDVGLNVVEKEVELYKLIQSQESELLQAYNEIELIKNDLKLLSQSSLSKLTYKPWYKQLFTILFPKTYKYTSSTTITSSKSINRSKNAKSPKNKKYFGHKNGQNLREIAKQQVLDTTLLSWYELNNTLIYTQEALEESQRVLVEQEERIRELEARLAASQQAGVESARGRDEGEKEGEEAEEEDGEEEEEEEEEESDLLSQPVVSKKSKPLQPETDETVYTAPISSLLSSTVEVGKEKTSENGYVGLSEGEVDNLMSMIQER